MEIVIVTKRLERGVLPQKDLAVSDGRASVSQVVDNRFPHLFGEGQLQRHTRLGLHHMDASLPQSN